MKRPVLVALLVLAAVAPAVVPASSPPEPLCSVCDDNFERTVADQYGLNASVAHSTVTVRVGENGTGHWTVRNRLENETVADRLRDNSDWLVRIVRTAIGESYGKPGPDRLSNVSAGVQNRTVVVTFAYENFADRVGSGVLLVDYFRAPGRESYGLVADRFTVVGPEGSRIVKGPAVGWDEATEVTVGRNETATGGSAAGESTAEVTWATREERDEYHVDSYVEDTYVAFGPNDGLAQTAALRIALAGRALPTVLGNLALLLPAGIALAVGLGGYRTVVSAFFARQRPTRLAGAVFAVGLLAVVHPFYAGSVPLINDDIPALSALGVAYALVGATAFAVASFRGKDARETDARGMDARGPDARRVPWWWLLAPAVATPPVAALAVVALSYPDTFREVSETVLLGVPLAAVFPLGYTSGSGDPRAKRRAGGAALALVAVPLLRFFSFTEPSALAGLVAIIGVFLTVMGLLFGAPLYLLGGALASGHEASEET